MRTRVVHTLVPGSRKISRLASPFALTEEEIEGIKRNAAGYVELAARQLRGEER